MSTSSPGAAGRTDIVIVTYNSARVIASCLESLVRVWEGGASVTVVDNASQDETGQVVRNYAWAQFVPNQENRGFAGGVNQGAQMGSGRYVLLLNPDTALLSADLGRMEAACEEHGLASGLLVDEDGEPQRGFFARRLPTPAALSFEALGLNRLWPSNPVNRKYRRLDFFGREEAFVEQPPGAFLMVRRDVWERLGGMDETFYPVWFEDADLCRRAMDHGYRIRFTPDCCVQHEGGHSVLRVDETVRGVHWYGSLLRYATKHFRPFWFGVVCVAVAVGAVARALAARFEAGHGRARTALMYGTIVRLAVQSLLTGKVAPSGETLQANAKSVVSAVRQ